MGFVMDKHLHQGLQSSRLCASVVAAFLALSSTALLAEPASYDMSVAAAKRSQGVKTEIKEGWLRVVKETPVDHSSIGHDSMLKKMQDAMKTPLILSAYTDGVQAGGNRIHTSSDAQVISLLTQEGVMNDFRNEKIIADAAGVIKLELKKDKPVSAYVVDARIVQKEQKQYLQVMETVYTGQKLNQVNFGGDSK
jgi:hypothetical protein